MDSGRGVIVALDAALKSKYEAQVPVSKRKVEPLVHVHSSVLGSTRPLRKKK